MESNQDRQPETTGTGAENIRPGQPDWVSDFYCALAKGTATVGDCAGFIECLHEEYALEIRLFAYQYLKSISGSGGIYIEAEDVLQETLMRAYKWYLKRIKDTPGHDALTASPKAGDGTTATRTNVRAWLYSIAKNYIHDKKKKHKRDLQIMIIDGDGDLMNAGPEPSALTRVQNNELRAWLDECIDRLTPKRRQAFDLHEAGLSNIEGAGKMKIKPSAFGKNLSDANEQLRQCMGIYLVRE